MAAKISSFGAGAFTPVPMQADPRMWRQTQDRYWEDVLAKENAERDRKMRDLEQQIAQYERRRGQRGFTSTDEMKYQRLVKQYNAVLNPSRGITKILSVKEETPQEKQQKALEKEMKRQTRVADLYATAEQKQAQLGPFAARQELKEIERLTGQKVTDPKVLSSLQKLRKDELAIQEKERKGKVFEAQQETVKKLNELITEQTDPNTVAALKDLIPQIRAGTVTPTAALGMAQQIAEAKAQQDLADKAFRTEERLAGQAFTTSEREARQKFSQAERVARQSENERLRVSAQNLQNEMRRWSMAESENVQNKNRIQRQLDEIDRLIARNRAWQNSDNPEDVRIANEAIKQLEALRQSFEEQLGSVPAQAALPQATMGAAPAGGGGQQNYRSAEDVRAAFASGELSESDAVRILREQFGYQ